jgi:hypothetical protein
MSTARKKVLVRRFTGDVLPGYLPVSGIVRSSMLELLDLGGRIVPLPLADIKMVSYVREFNLADAVNPERLTRRTFLARPRTEGLWVRLTFRTGDVLEGLAPTDRTLLDAMRHDAGLHLTPPDTRSNAQHLFVPHDAIADLQLLAVITTPSRKKPLPTAAEDPRKTLQDKLFETAPLPGSRPN